jgi:hypothetical protein
MQCLMLSQEFKFSSHVAEVTQKAIGETLVEQQGQRGQNPRFRPPLPLLTKNGKNFAFASTSRGVQKFVASPLSQRILDTSQNKS